MSDKAGLGFMLLVLLAVSSGCIFELPPDRESGAEPQPPPTVFDSEQPIAEPQRALESKPEPAKPEDKAVDIQQRWEAEQRRLGFKWNIETSQDSLSGGEITTAYVKSLNRVEFDFPYGGLQRATLSRRVHPRFGTDVIISIERGQFLCVLGCTVTVRFGDGPAVAWSASGPADHSTTVLFLKDAESFIARMKTVDTVRIAASIYQEGERAFEFDVSQSENSSSAPKPPPEPTAEELAEAAKYKAEVEQARAERHKREQAQAAAERETKAANKLRLADQLYGKGKRADAKRWYQAVVREFPGTKAAAEAAKKLGE